MGSARPRSTTGLNLLDAQHMVSLSGTDLHQDSLRWYAPPVGGPPSQVEVELLPAPIRYGPQAGWWGIEARIDGDRVGELIHPEAGWYWPLVDGALRHGLRPGVEAHVVLGEFGGIDVELYFPVIDPYAAAPPPRPPRPSPTPVTMDARPVRDRRQVPLWMGVAAAAILVIMVASLAVDRITRTDPITASPAPDTTLALAAEEPGPPSPVAPVPAPVPSPAISAPAAAPRMSVAARKPRPKATAKRVPVVAKPKATPKPKPKPPARTKPPAPTPGPPSADPPEPDPAPRPKPPTLDPTTPPDDSDPPTKTKPKPRPPADEPSDSED